MAEDAADRMRRARAEARRVALPILQGDDVPPRKLAREEAFASNLAAGGGARGAMAAADCSEKILDAFVERTLASGPKIACHRGCAWCCYTHVVVTIPEAMLLVAWAKQNLSPEALARAKARLAENAALGEGKAPEEYPRRACAFLVDGACSVYPARPGLCRAATSVDEARCRGAYEAGGDGTIPARRDVGALADAVRAGYKESLAHARLEPGSFELQQTVTLLFEDPNVPAKWAAGERVERLERARLRR